MTDAGVERRPEPVRVPGEAELAEAGLRLDVDGAVATVTLNRPERRNAMTFATWRGLAAIGRSLPSDVRVVVLKGEGPSFSAGIDLGMFSGGGEGFSDGADAEATDRFIAGLQEGYTWLRRPDIVTIAAVHGHAIGGGFQLALACDLRVAADDAKFCMKEPALGLVPDLTGTKPLVEIVGVPRALELCLTARTVLADEAARLGLAEIVVPRDGLDAAVADLVTALLAVNPGAAVATKRLLWQAPENTLEEQCAAERREQIGRLRELFGK
ncbi:enoyl-CoA hydratase/isomerase family protein [Actinomadura rubrisoli]|uniref:Enoyl-CoA hydratase/isomerase family protein n=1 Tax=Actinomadura rubrisoli TaxID=2530368 RepID=A0A4R5CF62_9ACTN|nr:enoyl-CoA hydratase/isomerase family protein [Actinomadura rubrisoli]TDD95864.1 enoyl-CoA hydratase/isomerase family protein [Actinomadura rubrisoli]